LSFYHIVKATSKKEPISGGPQIGNPIYFDTEALLTQMSDLLTNIIKCYSPGTGTLSIYRLAKYLPPC